MRVSFGKTSKIHCQLFLLTDKKEINVLFYCRYQYVRTLLRVLAQLIKMVMLLMCLVHKKRTPLLYVRLVPE